MVTSNTATLFKTILWDLVGNVVYFPVWWYTKGLAKMGGFFVNFVSGMEMRLAVRIWIANILKPMYAVTDVPGRIISFLMRVFMIIVRSFALVAVTIFAGLVFLGYLILPVFLTLMIILQISGIF
jgi:hypothetical protein